MIVINGYIIAVSQGDENYETVIGKINSKPSDPTGYQYKLRADTLEWELVELPTPVETELDDSEALSIITGESE